MNKQKLIKLIINCHNFNDLNKINNQDYNKMDSETKDLYYDMAAILFNKKILKSNNYPNQQCSSDINKWIQSKIDFKYKKIEMQLNKIKFEEKIENSISNYNSHQKYIRNLIK